MSVWLYIFTGEWVHILPTYSLQVKVGDNEYVHLRVYKTLPHAGSELSLTSLQEGKAVDDPLEYFWDNSLECMVFVLNFCTQYYCTLTKHC